MKITSNIIFLKEDLSLYKLNNGEFQPIKIIDIDSLEDYILLIDDLFFFYFTPEFPSKNIRKLKLLIHNYLIANYPENLIKHYDFVERKGKLLLYIISEDFMDFYKNNAQLFENAQLIISPIFLLWDNNYNGTYFDGKRYYLINNANLKYEVNLDEYIDIKNIVKDFLSIPSQSLNIPGLKKERGFLGKYKRHIIICGIAYLFFITGMFLHLISEKKNLDKINSSIHKLYKEAKVADNPDPYGLLLYKASKGQKSPNFKVLPIFEIISVSLPENTVINSFYYKNKIVKLEGLTSDFLKIDEFKNNLSKSFKGEIIIGNTIKQNDKVKFSITCKIRGY